MPKQNYVSESIVEFVKDKAFTIIPYNITGHEKNFRNETIWVLPKNKAAISNKEKWGIISKDQVLQEGHNTNDDT